MTSRELTLQELAQAAGLTYENCRYRLRSLGIEPSRQIGRNKLYSASTVEQVKLMPKTQR